VSAWGKNVSAAAQRASHAPEAFLVDDLRPDQQRSTQKETDQARLKSGSNGGAQFRRVFGFFVLDSCQAPEISVRQTVAGKVPRGHRIRIPGLAGAASG